MEADGTADIGQPAERLTEDDRAGLAAEQWLAGRIAAHRLAAGRRRPEPVPGVCRNCGEACAALYCDADCRADHNRRQGRPR